MSKVCISLHYVSYNKSQSNQNITSHMKLFCRLSWCLKCIIVFIATERAKCNTPSERAFEAEMINGVRLFVACFDLECKKCQCLMISEKRNPACFAELLSIFKKFEIHYLHKLRHISLLSTCSFHPVHRSCRGNWSLFRRDWRWKQSTRACRRFRIIKAFLVR